MLRQAASTPGPVVMVSLATALPFGTGRPVVAHARAEEREA
ncbi:hypothetical protein [Roseicella aerolata]|nr:hypothetical protein [Roseicella aerolata]